MTKEEMIVQEMNGIIRVVLIFIILVIIYRTVKAAGNKT